MNENKNILHGTMYFNLFVNIFFVFLHTEGISILLRLSRSCLEGLRRGNPFRHMFRSRRRAFDTFFTRRRGYRESQGRDGRHGLRACDTYV